MRTSILALSSKDLNQIAHDTIVNCSVTHADPYCVASAVFNNLLIANLIRHQVEIEEAKADGVKVAERMNVDIAINDALSQSIPFISNYTTMYNKKLVHVTTGINDNDPYKKVIRESADKNFAMIDANEVVAELTKYVNTTSYGQLDLNDMVSYTMIPVGVSVQALRKMARAMDSGKDCRNLFMETIMEIVREGGDADTNCAIAGAVCGALIGYSALPERMINSISYKKFFDETTREFLDVIAASEDDMESSN